MRLLNGLFGLETKGASASGAVDRASGASGFTGVSSGILSTVLSDSSWDMDKTVSQAYERVIWVFRCVDAIASNQCSIPIIFRDLDDAKQLVEDRQLAYLLNRRPNSYETAAQFRYRLSSQLLLSKLGVFVEVVAARNGRAGALHLLPPGKVTPIPDAKTFVKGYKVQKGHNEFDILSPEQVIWIRTKPHPTKPYEQVTPLTAAGLAVDTDFLARLYNRQFLANNGKPGLLISIHGQMPTADAQEIKRRFSGGPALAGQTTVIESDGITVQDLFSSPSDVQWLQAIAGSKEDILLAFGVAESFLGNASGRTFDNADAEFEITWTTTMVPHCNSIAAGFDRLTAPSLQADNLDNIEVAYDYSKIDVLQRQERNRHAKADADFAAGKITHDEWREACGLDPFDIPATRVIWLPAGKVPVGKDDQDTQEAAALQQVGMGQPIDPSQSAYQGATLGSQQAQRQLANITAARAIALAGRKSHPRVIEGSVVAAREGDTDSEEDDRAVGPDNEFRALVEGQVEGILTAWSSRQADVFGDRLEHVKVRKNTRHWDGEPGTKALDPKYVVELTKWKADVRRDLHDALVPLAQRQAKRVALDLSRNGIVSKMHARGWGNPAGRSAIQRVTSDPDALVEQVLDRVLVMAEKAAERQSQRVMDTITQMDSDGKSLAEIKKAVKDMVDARGSWRKALAIHSTTAMMEGVKTAVYGEAKSLITRRWNTQHDERVRPSHKKAEGQKRLSNRPFRVGSSTLAFPGDPTAPIEETANCRCYISWTDS